MKKSHILLSIILVLLLGLAAVYASNIKLAETPDDVINILRQEHEFSEDNNTIISYAGEFVKDESALLWFVFQKNYYIYYEAVECQILKNGGYLLKTIYRPNGSFAPNIVHLDWKGEEVILINHPDCRAIVYSDGDGNIVSETKLSSSDIPYLFLLQYPANPMTFTFKDAEGKSLSSVHAASSETPSRFNRPA